MHFQQYLREYIEIHGYWVLFAGTFLEGEAVLIMAGFLAFQGHLHGTAWGKRHALALAVGLYIDLDQALGGLGRRSASGERHGCDENKQADDERAMV